MTWRPGDPIHFAASAIVAAGDVQLERADTSSSPSGHGGVADINSLRQPAGRDQARGLQCGDPIQFSTKWALSNQARDDSKHSQDVGVSPVKKQARTRCATRAGPLPQYP